MASAISGPAGREYSMGDVTRLLGVSRSWIKTREGNGQLPLPRRTPGGHRTYNTEELHRIRELAASSGLRADEAGSEFAEAPQESRSLLGRRIAVINQKGGVGKTTVTQNLGFALGNRGARSLLVDLDRQYNLTTCCGVDIGDESDRGLGYALLESALGRDGTEAALRSVTPTSNPYVDLIPNNVLTFDAQVALEGQRFVGPYRLSEMLDPLAGSYDFTLIDCPPDLGTLTVMGLVAAEAVIIPVDYHLAVQALKQLMRTLDQVAKIYRPIRVLGVVLNKFDSRTTNSRYVEETIQSHFGDVVFRTRIGQSAKIPEATVLGRPIVESEPRHPVARQFDDLAEEVIERARALRGGCR